MGSPGAHAHTLYVFWLQLLFAFTLDEVAAPKSSTTALKGLGLAVRGALESICGEAASTLVQLGSPLNGLHLLPFCLKPKFALNPIPVAPFDPF